MPEEDPIIHTLAILVAPDGAIHCTLNAADPASRLIVLGPRTRFPSWLEFFASFTHPATALLLSMCANWHVQYFGGVQWTDNPPPIPDPITYH